MPGGTSTTIEPMSSDGLSASWIANKSNQVRAANVFLKDVVSSDAERSKRWGTSWDAMPEEQSATKDFFECFNNWLCSTYRVEKTGKFLELGSVKGIWRGLMYQLKQKLGASTKEATKVRVRALSLQHTRTVC